MSGPGGRLKVRATKPGGGPVPDKPPSAQSSEDRSPDRLSPGDQSFVITPRGPFSLRQAAPSDSGQRDESRWDGVMRLAVGVDTRPVSGSGCAQVALGSQDR